MLLCVCWNGGTLVGQSDLMGYFFRIKAASLHPPWRVDGSRQPDKVYSQFNRFSMMNPRVEP
jgi:hypothetical protein